MCSSSVNRLAPQVSFSGKGVPPVYLFKLKAGEKVKLPKHKSSSCDSFQNHKPCNLSAAAFPNQNLATAAAPGQDNPMYFSRFNLDASCAGRGLNYRVGAGT